jgi:hypothetical protein
MAFSFSKHGAEDPELSLQNKYLLLAQDSLLEMSKLPQMPIHNT